MRKRVSHGFGSVALRTDAAFQSCRGPPESGEPPHVVDLEGCFKPAMRRPRRPRSWFNLLAGSANLPDPDREKPSIDQYTMKREYGVPSR